MAETSRQNLLGTRNLFRIYEFFTHFGRTIVKKTANRIDLRHRESRRPWQILVSTIFGIFRNETKLFDIFDFVSSLIAFTYLNLFRLTLRVKEREYTLAYRSTRLQAAAAVLRARRVKHFPASPREFPTEKN